MRDGVKKAFLKFVGNLYSAEDPPARLTMICGQRARTYRGHETRDDEDKVQGLRDPKAL